jgi:hypothetical protein
VKLIEFSVVEWKESKSDYIKSDYYDSSATDFKVTLILASTGFDTNYTAAMLRNTVCNSYQIIAYPDSGLLGEPYPTAWTFSDSFWIQLSNGNYKFSEYFENTPVTREILKAIDNIVNSPTLDTADDVINCNLFRLIKALENFWD